MAMRVSYHRAVVKLVFLCARKPGLDHAQYEAHLLERHAPLALRHHASLRRYVLNVVEGEDEIDSVNALYYDSLEDFEKRNYDSAAGERIVVEDHARFLGGASGYLTQESVLCDLDPKPTPGFRSPGVKWICALRGPRGLEAELVPALLAGSNAASYVAIDRVERRLYDGGADWDAFLEVRLGSSISAPSLRAQIEAHCEATALWRVAEYVQRGSTRPQS